MNLIFTAVLVYAIAWACTLIAFDGYRTHAYTRRGSTPGQYEPSPTIKQVDLLLVVVP